MEEIKKPKMRPLVIETLTGLNRTIRLSTLTEEAEQWVRDNAAEFGSLTYDTDRKHFNLLVHGGYKRDDIVTYLTSLWDTQQWPVEVDAVVE